jgi:hypothetical protein
MHKEGLQNNGELSAPRRTEILFHKAHKTSSTQLHLVANGTALCTPSPKTGRGMGGKERYVKTRKQWMGFPVHLGIF